MTKINMKIFQKQQHRFRFYFGSVLIAGFECAALISPGVANPPLRIACEVEIQKLLSELQSTDRDYALNSATYTPENPTMVHLEEKRTALRLLLDRDVHHCPSIRLSDTLIIPGKRFGPITQRTTYQNLVEHFGNYRLINRDFFGSEGEVTLPSTEVRLLGVNQTSTAFTVVWKNNLRNAPLQVFTTDPAWKTVEGIHVGMTFSQLQKIIGEFQINGIEWDYGNQVIINQARWQKHFNRFSISIALQSLASEQFPKDYEAVSGENYISSLNPHWKNLKPSVSSLHLSFDN
jgi:hypothetical protein